MKYTVAEINIAITAMFNEHSFNRKYRKSVRKSILYYLKNPSTYTQLRFRGLPIVIDN